MKTRHKNLAIVCTTVLVACVCIGIALNLKSAANETKEVAKEEVRKTGDHVRDKIDEKIDASSAQIANDYKSVKEVTKNTAKTAVDKYNKWKQDRAEAKTNK